MARKAALGFKYLSESGSMMLPDEDDFENWEESKKLTSHDKVKLVKRRCYHKNKEKYNRQKRISEARVEKKYKAAKRFAEFRNQGWEFTQEDWEQAWMDAGRVMIPGSQSLDNPDGKIVPAYALRGTHRYNNTCMQRVDNTKPWGPDNYKIMYRGEELKPGSTWYRPWSNTD